ncbi:YeeE/YedE family protein [Vibrio viridaestus]|uniref:YeeE/YedE family protein n=1 Tax=Vibrio viridaestus TaxID=2487322 RepID=A0A3N9TEA0_9VIBR|nr:YeeE/YedE family protein [Vibrio viridaestus]RQW62551.1 YeeE/YedE family protein [Vibrio viridaestus]
MHDIELALIGGALLGVSASLLLFFNGKIAGISGILSSAINPRKTSFCWSILFCIGLVGGGVLAHQLFPTISIGHIGNNIAVIVLAGLCVGVGTRLANGCTSGHSICGVGRFSIRSIVATVIFMFAAFITTYIKLHLL